MTPPHHNTDAAPPLGEASMLEVALEYHRRGWSIIPIKTGTKKPACQKWKGFQTKRPTEATIKRWFNNRADRGMAVILGEVSGGLVCRDFDKMASYRQWAAEHPNLALTLPTVATAHGRHVYFLADHHGIVHLGDGELRGGGYCLLPPSLHPDGPEYRWLVPLPDGDLPRVEDLDAAGFRSAFFLDAVSPDDTHATERTETTESTDDDRGLPRSTEAIGGREDFGSLQDDQDIERVILETLPTVQGKRNRLVFELARTLKAIPRLADAAVDDLQCYVRCWHRYGVERGVIGTEPFEETWIDFLVAWPKVKFPKGAEPMTAIFQRAQEASPCSVATRYEQDGLRLLVALCRELQRASGDHPFFLACRTAGRLLDVHYTTAWRWLFLLQHDGIVQEVEKGDQKTKRASRYRYLAD